VHSAVPVTTAVYCCLQQTIHCTSLHSLYLRNSAFTNFVECAGSYLALKNAREIFTTGTQSGKYIFPYKALTVKTNETTAMLLINICSFLHTPDGH